MEESQNVLMDQPLAMPASVGIVAPLSLTPTEQRILDGIRCHPGHSRAEFAEDMGLSKAMLSKAVGRFADLGLVREVREETPSGGRGQPALRLTIIGSSLYGIGINISTRGLHVALVDVSCRVLASTSRPPFESLDPRGVLPVVEDCVRDLMSHSAVSGSLCVGIGIDVRGFVNRLEQIEDMTPSQSEVPYDALRDGLAENFDLPVYFESVPQAYFEASQPDNRYHTIFHVIIDYGIGGAFAEGTTIYRGGFNQAGNIGALMPEPEPRPSLTDLARYLDEPLRAMTNERLEEMLASDDQRLRAWFETRGPVASTPLSIVVQLFNPEAIIFGGALPAAFYERLIPYIDLSVFDVPGRMALNKPDMRVSGMTGEAGRAVSAAAVPVGRLFM